MHKKTAAMRTAAGFEQKKFHIIFKRSFLQNISKATPNAATAEIRTAPAAASFAFFAKWDLSPFAARSTALSTAVLTASRDITTPTVRKRTAFSDALSLHITESAATITAAPK